MVSAHKQANVTQRRATNSIQHLTNLSSLAISAHLQWLVDSSVPSGGSVLQSQGPCHLVRLGGV